MRRARVMTALVLAVLWLPVTMHCALEALPGFEFLICCAHDEAIPHNECEASGCAVVESGFYKLQDHEDLVTPAAGIDAFDVFGSEPDNPNPLIAAARPPPDLIVGWQFSFRAAPPVRAPSLLL